jgi:hypothetical protein
MPKKKTPAPEDDNRPVCMIPNCGSRKYYSRGLCGRCYRQAMHWIKKGLTSWHELEQKGLSFPQGFRRKKKDTPFQQAFTKALGGQNANGTPETTPQGTEGEAVVRPECGTRDGQESTEGTEAPSEDTERPADSGSNQS